MMQMSDYPAPGSGDRSPLCPFVEFDDELHYAPLSEFGPSIRGNRMEAKAVIAVPALGNGNLTNAHQLKGCIAFMERGVVDFSTKVLRAQEAGAIAVIVANNDEKEPDVAFVMSSSNSKTSLDIRIPSVMLSMKASAQLRQYIQNDKNGLVGLMALDMAEAALVIDRKAREEREKKKIEDQKRERSEREEQKRAATKLLRSLVGRSSGSCSSSLSSTAPLSTALAYRSPWDQQQAEHLYSSSQLAPLTHSESITSHLSPALTLSSSAADNGKPQSCAPGRSCRESLSSAATDSMPVASTVVFPSDLLVADAAGLHNRQNQSQSGAEIGVGVGAAQSGAGGLPTALMYDIGPIQPQSSVLLVFDVQYYCALPQTGRFMGVDRSERPYYFDRVRDLVIPNLQMLERYCRHHRVEVVFTRLESATRNGRDRSLSHKLSGIHVPRGSHDARILDAVAPLDDEIIISRTASSIFLSTNIDYILRNLRARSLILCGLNLNECMTHAAREAADRGYSVSVIADACASENESLEYDFLQESQSYGKISDTSSFIAELQAAVYDYPAAVGTSSGGVGLGHSELIVLS